MSSGYFKGKQLSKRLFAFTAAVVMTLCASGCGESTQEESNNNSSQADAPTESARVTVEGTKFMVDGKELWINGVNTPWQKWNDFDGNMDEQFWDDTFAKLAQDGINCTRIWINCAGENIVKLDADGGVREVNSAHWENLDSLFEIAEKHKVYVMATLLSFDHFKGETSSADKWRTLITNKETCDEYAEKYVGEFCDRYGDNEYLFSIDIMNEPDWVYENEECGNIPWDNLSYFFGKCAAVIHERCETLVTVGLAMSKYNSDQYEGNMVSDEYLKELTGSENAYLDFYSPHFYMWQREWFGFPFTETPAEYGLEEPKPCVIAETSNDDADECGLTLTEKYQSAYENGWNGVMVWMQTDDNSEWYCYDLTQEATKAMAEFIPEKIYPLDSD